MKTNKLILSAILLLICAFSYAQKGVIINQGAKMVLNSGAVLVIGDDLGLINNSNETILNGTVIFSGNALQEIGGSQSSIFSVLEIDNFNGVLLNNDSRITDELLLTSGVLDISDYNLTLNDITDINGTFSSSTMINVDGNGVLIKELSNNDIFLLPLGDLTAGADYSPVEFGFLSGNYSNAYISINVKNDKHPDNLSTNDYLNRYWAMGSGGITNLSYNMTFTYVSGDVVGNEANIYGAIRDNGSWSSLGQVSSNQFTGTSDIIEDVTGLQSDQVGLFDIFKEKIEITHHNGTIFINERSGLKINSISVFDAAGKHIANLALKNTGYNEIPFSPKTGYYLLSVNTDKGNFTKKIFIN